MIEVLEFVFIDLWHWLGSMILLMLIATCLINVVEIIVKTIEQKKAKVDHEKPRMSDGVDFTGMPSIDISDDSTSEEHHDDEDERKMSNHQIAREQVQLWHPDKDGSWKHIVQRTNNNCREYYTDGELIATQKVINNVVVFTKEKPCVTNS